MNDRELIERLVGALESVQDCVKPGIHLVLGLDDPLETIRDAIAAGKAWLRNDPEHPGWLCPHCDTKFENDPEEELWQGCHQCPECGGYTNKLAEGS